MSSSIAKKRKLSVEFGAKAAGDNKASPTATLATEKQNGNNASAEDDDGDEEEEDNLQERKSGRRRTRKSTSPLVGIRITPNSRWYEVKQHKFHTEEEILERITKFVFDEANYDCCYNARGFETNCTCLHDVLTKREDGETALQNCAYALYYDYYRFTNTDDTHRYLTEQIRHADAFEYALDLTGVASTGKRANPKKFLMPRLTPSVLQSYTLRKSQTKNEENNTSDEGKAGEDDGRTNDNTLMRDNNCNKTRREEEPNRKFYGPFLCKWAFCRLHSIGRDKFEELFLPDGVIKGRKAKAKKQQLNGNIGNTNRNKRFGDAYDSIHSFLGELKKIADPVDSKSTSSASKSKGKLLILPQEMTITSLYGQWAYSRGWVMKLKAGAVLPLEQWEKRETSCGWPPGSEPKIIVSLRTFRRLWEEHYPDLRVRDQGNNSRSKLSA